MKRLAIALSIIVLLAVLSPCLSSLAQPTHIPHQNPAWAKDSPGLTSLLLFYSNAFELASISQYQDAQILLDELEYANIPDELRYIVDRYSTLSRQLFTTLDNLETIPDEASTLLAHYQVSDAKQKLDEAEAPIHSARFLLGDIEAVTNTLGERLGAWAAPAGSQIRQAHDRLQESVHRPRQLTDEVNQLRQSLTEKYKAQVQGELIATELSLNITPGAVFIGDSITSSGRLTGVEGPLANRKVTVLLDNKPLVVTTDLDGSYTSNITIPYRYVSTMTLSAVYTAFDYDDIGTYLGCASSPVVVNTSFYPTLLEVSAPETAYSGLPITISGQVSSTDGAVDRTIKVFLDNTRLAQEIIRGQFSLQVTLPQLISTGKHSLTLVVIPQGHYSSASKSLTINISTQIPIQMDIQVPPVIIIPVPVRVSGKVYHELDAIPDAWVSFAFMESSTAIKTSADGSFATAIKAAPELSISTPISSNFFYTTITTVELPLDPSLAGPQELAITIEPVEPGYAPLQIKRQIFSINPANLSLMLVVFISLGLLVFNRVRTRLPSPREETVILKAKLRESATVAPAPRPKYKLTGIKGRILSVYLNGLGAVERVTSIPMTPHTTLREFLKAATPQLTTAIKPFTELTAIAEVALYSSHKLEENTATRVELLAGIIKEELHSGTA